MEPGSLPLTMCTSLRNARAVGKLNKGVPRLVLLDLDPPGEDRRLGYG